MFTVKPNAIAQYSELDKAVMDYNKTTAFYDNLFNVMAVVTAGVLVVCVDVALSINYGKYIIFSFLN